MEAKSQNMVLSIYLSISSSQYHCQVPNTDIITILKHKENTPGFLNMYISILNQPRKDVRMY